MIVLVLVASKDKGCGETQMQLATEILLIALLLNKAHPIKDIRQPVSAALPLKITC